MGEAVKPKLRTFSVTLDGCIHIMDQVRWSRSEL